MLVLEGPLEALWASYALFAEVPPLLELGGIMANSCFARPFPRACNLDLVYGVLGMGLVP